MVNFGIKYFVVLAVVVGFFSHVIACGTQMYLISVKEDFDGTKSNNIEMADPAAVHYGIHATEGWTSLPIHVNFGNTLTPDQRDELLKAMQQWEWAVGKKLFENSGVQQGIDGDNFDDLYSSLDDETNGNYLDNNWSKTRKPDHVLATTIWNNAASDSAAITKADIRFNAQHYVIGNSLTMTASKDKEIVDMQSLALHELGHLLGLAHVEPSVDKYSIMNPALFIGEGLTARELAKSDILRIQQIYGCQGTACDIDHLLAEQKAAVSAATTEHPDKKPEDGSSQTRGEFTAH